MNFNFEVKTKKHYRYLIILLDQLKIKPDHIQQG